MEERALIRALRRGDPAGLEALIAQYTPFASAVAGHILRGAPRDVEEVVSDAFLAVWDHAAKLRPGKVRAYLGAVVRNRAKNRLRSLGRDLPLEEDVLELERTAEDGPAAALERSERAALVRETLDALSPEDRAIFLRHYYHCQSVAEIAAALDMNPATVKTRLHRGRKKLKELLLERGYFCEAEDLGSDGCLL